MTDRTPPSEDEVLRQMLNTPPEKQKPLKDKGPPPEIQDFKGMTKKGG